MQDNLIDTIQSAALEYAASGISVIPVDPVEKTPRIKWKQFQKEIAKPVTIKSWFSKKHSIAMICGSASGNIEVIDIDNHFKDAEKLFNEWSELVKNTDPDLYPKLIIQQTQSHGYHVIYRCDKPGGNQKLALRAKGPSRDTLFETRGEGGYVILAPSIGYSLLQNDFNDIPVISNEQRSLLLDTARVFNEIDDKPFENKSEHERPGDEFNRRSNIKDLLTPHGWHLISETNEKQLWRRPGKDRGVSATFGYINGKFYNFSSNAYPFESYRSYDKFAVYTLLQHNGDFKQAARTIAKEYNLQPTGEKKVTDYLQKNEKFKYTERGNSERFIEQWADKIKYNNTSGKWHIWDGKCWEMDQRKHIIELGKATVLRIYEEALVETNEERRQALSKHAVKSDTKAQISSMIELASSNSNISVLNEDFDANPYLINFNNGLYDLDKQQFLKHAPQLMLSKRCDVDYDPTAETVFFEDALLTIFNQDTELIEFVQRAVGLSLCGAHLEEVLFFCYGTGKNGKSVFFNVIKMIMNDYFMKAPTEMLMMRYNDPIPNDIARLPGARIVVAAELPENRALNENKVKDLTGGDPIMARFLHKEFFEFTPTHTLWIYGNHKPNIRGTDEGIWRRICMIPFTVTIPPEERRPQHELMRDFESEKSGILNWMLKGWEEYQKQGLNPPDSVRKATKEYKDEQDRIGDFLAECCELSSVNIIKASDLFKQYNEYCNENHEQPLTKKKFYKAIEEKSDISSEKVRDQKGFRGIDLNENFRKQNKVF